MKSASGIGMILLGAVLGVTASVGLGGRRADAQQPAAAVLAAQRFQVSAYAGPTGGGGLGHGCYILDTATGELWHARQGGQIQKVSEKIR